MNELLRLLEKYRPELSPAVQEAFARTLSVRDSFTTEQVALLYGITAATVREWLKMKKIEGTMTGARIWSFSLKQVLSANVRGSGAPRILSSSVAHTIKHSTGRTTDLALKYQVSSALITLIRKGERYSDV